MTEKYPFFRDEEETTQAVIGEDAAASDLEGHYQKPYAVLTQNRLYCKNEQGNFIADRSTLKSAEKGFHPRQSRFLWVTVGFVGFALVLLCFWSFFGRGLPRMSSLRSEARYYITVVYPEAKAEAADCKAQMAVYDEAQKKIDKYTRDADASRADYDKAQAERDKLDAELYSKNQEISLCQDEIQNYQNEIQNYKDSQATRLADAQSTVSRMQDDLSASQDQLTVFEQEVDAGTARKLVSAPELDTFYSEGVKMITIERGSSEYTLERDRYDTAISDAETALKEAQSTLDTLQQELSSNPALNYDAEIADRKASIEKLQKEIAPIEEKAATYAPTLQAFAAIMNNIDEQQNIQYQLDYGTLEAELQSFENSTAIYKTARRTQLQANLFVPCLVLFVAAFALLLILTLRRQTRLATLLGLIAALLSLLCYFTAVQLPPLLKVVPVLALLSALLSLWQLYQGAVFLVTHTNGTFSFVPSLYPAEELNTFAEQIKGPRAGKNDGT
ncbi:MAG: hypothetical protein RSC08_02740 [Oscillospiraceae bacterium]